MLENYGLSKIKSHSNFKNRPIVRKTKKPLLGCSVIRENQGKVGYFTSSKISERNQGLSLKVLELSKKIKCIKVIQISNKTMYLI